MLRVATYLGSNTMPALAALVDQVEAQTGIGLRFDQRAPGSSPVARAEAGDIDMVWMCGGLFAEMSQSGDLDHQAFAAPIFDGETSPVYRSVIVARPDGPDTIDDALLGSVAINERESWSGHRALRRHVSPRWFASEVMAGSHLGSIDVVHAGAAGCAAIDNSIWDDQRATGSTPANELVVIDETADWPAPPLLIRRGVDPEVRAALASAVLAAHDVPGLHSIVAATDDTYDVMAVTPSERQYLS